MELAAGEAVLHQVKETGTLLAENDHSSWYALAAIGYKVKWDEELCPDRTGLDRSLENVESEISLRVKALSASDQMGLSSQVWRWMQDFKERYAQVPNELVARIIFTKAATCSHLPVAASGCKWLQVAASGCQWLQVTGCKWLQVAASEWLQVAASGCKWLQVAASGCKWLQVAAWASGCKWLQVAACSCKWL